MQSAGVAEVIAIAAGSYHSLALKANGHVLAWGSNGSGELGNGTTTYQPTAVEVTSAPGVLLTDVVAIAAGQTHSLALKADGSVWAWGWNNVGQLGDGTTTNRTRATAVGQMQGAVAIGAGSQHSLALKGADGSGWSWGRGDSGQLGDGTTTATRPLPAAVDGVTGALAVKGGLTHSLALGVDGLAWAWGYNNSGQLGDGTQLLRKVPVRVVGLSGAGALVAGGQHSLALANGEAWVWGRGDWGQLGDGTTAAYRVQPTRLSTLSNLVALGAGAYHSLAIDSAGSVWSWGYNNYSQLGDGTTGLKSSPVSVSAPGFAWRVGTPEMSVAPGTYALPQTVTLTSSTSGASIFYSTNGGDPTTPYTGAIADQRDDACSRRAPPRPALADSNLASALYTLKVVTPTFSPGGELPLRADGHDLSPDPTAGAYDSLLDETAASRRPLHGPDR